MQPVTPRPCDRCVAPVSVAARMPSLCLLSSSSLKSQVSRLVVRPVGFEPTPTWLKARDAAVTPRPHSWSGISVCSTTQSTSCDSCWFVLIREKLHSSGSPGNRTQHDSVISRVWATSPRLPNVAFCSAKVACLFESRYFRGAKDDAQSGTSESNRDPPAPKAGVLPSAPLPDCQQPAWESNPT